jgi:hypothetical protein
LGCDGNVAEVVALIFLLKKMVSFFTPSRDIFFPASHVDSVIQLCKKLKIEGRQQRILPPEVFLC